MSSQDQEPKQRLTKKGRLITREYGILSPRVPRHPMYIMQEKYCLPLCFHAGPGCRVRAVPFCLYNYETMHNDIDMLSFLRLFLGARGTCHSPVRIIIQFKIFLFLFYPAK